jgi:hypothetical protein
LHLQSWLGQRGSPAAKTRTAILYHKGDLHKPRAWGWAAIAEYGELSELARENFILLESFKKYLMPKDFCSECALGLLANAGSGKRAQMAACVFDCNQTKAIACHDRRLACTSSATGGLNSKPTFSNITQLAATVLQHLGLVDARLTVCLLVPCCAAQTSRPCLLACLP